MFYGSSFQKAFRQVKLGNYFLFYMIQKKTKKIYPQLLSLNLDIYTSSYDNFVVLGYFNFEIDKKRHKGFMS